MGSNRISGAVSQSAGCSEQSWEVRGIKEELQDVQYEQGLPFTCSPRSLINMLPWTHIRCRDLAGVVESPYQPAGPPLSKQFNHRYDKTGW